MKKIITLTLFLAITSAVAGGILAYVNELTAPIIDGMAIEAEKENLELIFPGADFEEVAFEDETGLVKGAYLAQGQGYIYKVEVVGYNSSSPVVFMIAYDNDANNVGFAILSQQETSGFGSRIDTPEFIDTVIGTTVNDSISTLSGATVTTKAVVSGINAAKAVYAIHAGVTVDVQEPTEPEAEVLTLSSAFATDAQIVENVDGVYTISAKGYVANNTVVVTITDGIVASVEVTEFNDTPTIGDLATTDEYLSSFVGKDPSSQVDVVSSATLTSKSILAAVQLALNDANGVVAVNLGNNDFSANKAEVLSVDGNEYVVSSYGYQANNEFVITLGDPVVISVVCSKFADSPGIGDLAITDEYLNTMVGYNLESEFDVVSGATKTSNSVLAAVQAALNAASKGE